MLVSHLRSDLELQEGRRQRNSGTAREARMSGHRILIVDDDPMNAKLLRYLLHDEGYATEIVTTLAEARRVLNEQTIDLVIGETILPDGSGLAFCQEVDKEYDVPFMFVSRQTTVKDTIDGIKAGARDYVVKPYEPAVVAIRVWAQLRRKAEDKPNEAVVRTPDFELDMVSSKVLLLRNNRTVGLTTKEANLLYCLVSNPNQTMTRDALMVRVWGYQYDSTNNQLDVYISRLRTKLEEQPSAPKLILTVRRTGYRYVPSTRTPRRE